MHRMAYVIRDFLQRGDVAGALEQFRLFSGDMTDEDVIEAMTILAEIA